MLAFSARSMRTTHQPAAVVRSHRRTCGPRASSAPPSSPAASSGNTSSPLVLALVRAASRKETELWRPPPLPPLVVSLPASRAAALTRVRTNLPLYAQVYCAFGLAVALLAGVVVSPLVSF